MSTTTVALRPIYGPSDPRWEPLAEAIRAIPDRTTTIEELLPTERAGWYETKVVGRDRSEVYLSGSWDFEYPTPAPDLFDPPRWTASKVPSDGGTDEFDRPTLMWDKEVASGEFATVYLKREDVFDPESNTVIRGEESLAIWIGDNPLDMTGWEHDYLAQPEGLVDLADVLLQAVVTLRPWEGRELRRLVGATDHLADRDV